MGLPLRLGAGFIGFVGNRYRLLCTGVRATLSDDTITVIAPRLMGLRTTAPEGTFRLTDDRCIRVERVAPPITFQPSGGSPFARVLLIGDGVAPDLRLLVDRREVAARAAEDLAHTLGVPVEQVSRPYEPLRPYAGPPAKTSAAYSNGPASGVDGCRGKVGASESWVSRRR